MQNYVLICFLIWKNPWCWFQFFVSALMILRMILNYMRRPKDLFWSQPAFSFSAVDIHSEKQNQYVCNDCLDNCICSCRKPSQQLFLRTCDKFSNPLTVTHACFQRMLSQLLLLAALDFCFVFNCDTVRCLSVLYHGQALPAAIGADVLMPVIVLRVRKDELQHLTYHTVYD